MDKLVKRKVYKPENLITVIKALRNMTKLLGKLDIKCLVKSWSHMEYDPATGQGKQMVQMSYGAGLKNCKDCVEGFLKRKYRPKSQKKKAKRNMNREERGTHTKRC